MEWFLREGLGSSVRGFRSVVALKKSLDCQVARGSGCCQVELGGVGWL